MRCTILLLAFAFPLPLAAQTRTITPLPAAPPGASQFDYLIGEWRFVGASQSHYGPPRFGGVWKAWKAFDGRGVQDEYRIVDTAGTTRYLGYTLRIYDPQTDAWTLTYLDVLRGTFHEQHGKKAEDGMHLWWEAKDPQGTFQSRVRYFDITPDHFRWQQDRSYDNGKTWIEGFLKIEATRTAAVAAR